MTKRLLVLWNDEMRAKAIAWVRNAPENTRLYFHKPARTLPQNDRFHAMIDDVSRQIKWTDVFGRPITMTPENWKRFFLRMWNREALIVPNEDGTGFYDLGPRSSEMSVEEMGDCMELISAFGAQRGVKFRDAAGREAPDAHSPESKEVA